MGTCIAMEQSDNVATALQEIRPGEKTGVMNRNMEQIGAIVSVETIPFAHKICLRSVKKGEYIYKFGVVIGRATADIPAGSLVHVHNLISIKGAETIRQGSGAI